MDEGETLADLDQLVLAWTTTATTTLAFSSFAERDFALIESRRTVLLESSPVLCVLEACPAYATEIDEHLLPAQYLERKISDP